MTGTASPSDNELRSNIAKRMYLLPGGGVTGLRGNSSAEATPAEKRYVANGSVRGALTSLRNGAKRDLLSDILGQLSGILGGKGGAAAAGAAGAASAAAAGDATGAAPAKAAKPAGKAGMWFGFALSPECS